MASRKRGSAETFGGLLQDILNAYAQQVTEGMEDALRSAAKSGVAELKKTSPKSSGAPSLKKHYATQWDARYDIRRVGSSAVIYNKDPTYRLAHLLENGHAKVNGGRVAAIPHIKPAEEKIIAEFESRLERAI